MVRRLISLFARSFLSELASSASEITTRDGSAYSVLVWPCYWQGLTAKSRCRIDEYDEYSNYEERRRNEQVSSNLEAFLVHLVAQVIELQLHLS